MEPKITDSEVLALIRRLEQCQLSPTEFHHRDHLAVSTAYLYAGDAETALASARTSLRRFIAHHGLKGYHETITRFWLLQIEGRLDRRAYLAEAVEKIQEELGDKNLIYQHYSREVLASDGAKERWVEPDLGPITC